ncbi:RTA1-domain-containing protein [Aureobasidium pullulans]|uniref:RTA1-domain-containing protein n=2 Tax=Aureobasidium pullulans TaxID=5580 RepID=A0AB74IZT6_AURPU|nr:RTA1-domain-containing protein [Aureobasidium pullulans]THX99331.1 RTA1-domain-containing protein [Aureobasidium pullulans]
MAIGTTGCEAYNPLQRTAYGYVPSLAAGIVYCVLFGLSMFFHVFQAIKTRALWNLVFAIGCLTEVLGWAARSWSNECPYNANAFLMQICTLIIAPTFFTAGIYVILGRMIAIAGPGVSPIGPTWYLWIFCTVDVISLVIQAVGGGSAAVAFNSTPPGNTKVGTNIMVAGIDFQLASVVIFSVLFFLFLYRAAVKLSLPAFKNDKDMKLLVLVTSFSILLIIMRSIYRTVELAGGWSGHVIETERYFLALDGAPMAALVIAFNILHPGILINRVMAHNGVSMSEKPSKRSSKSSNHDIPLSQESA